ncbi:tetraspanin-15-like [Magnolia sinica]|uniref:tetraspanin-15-like n=1 Tax=Magnolia sinica TaxID=86752 RepID=UPI0026589573|nr:tetraspanin-15-like [Magnolia sinica]
MDEAAESSPHQDETPKGSSMAAKISKILRLVSIFTYLISLPLLGSSIWLLMMHNYDCEDLLNVPRLRITIAIGMMVLFLLSNLVVFYGVRFTLPGFAAVMVMTTIMLTLGLAFVGTCKVESRAIPGSPLWLKMKVMDDEHWRQIKTCIFNGRMCSELGFRMQGLSAFDFNLKKLTRLESGCCKPPDICGMEYVNATYWNYPRTYNDYIPFSGTSTHASGGDCDAWSNIQSILCYDCHSCREGFLTTIQRRWRSLGVFLVLMNILIMVTQLIRFILTMLDKPKM